MTIDEAIKNCEKTAKECIENCAGTELYQCGKDFEQLSAWLRELKEAKKFIRKLQNELLKGTSFYSTSFYEENKELMDKLTEGVEYLDD